VLLIELFAGTGTISAAFHAHGWYTCGFDLTQDYTWPPELPHITADVRDLHRQAAEHRDLHSPARGLRNSQPAPGPPRHPQPAAGPPGILLWASPPCEEYSLAARRPPGFRPDTTLWQISADLAAAVACPYIIENVSGAQRWHGPAANHFGKIYLWGTGVPPLLPRGPRWKDRTHKTLRSTYRLRSAVPAELAEAIAAFHTAAHQGAAPPLPAPHTNL
jgi:hypothetical protein